MVGTIRRYRRHPRSTSRHRPAPRRLPMASTSVARPAVPASARPCWSRRPRKSPEPSSARNCGSMESKNFNAPGSDQTHHLRQPRRWHSSLRCHRHQHRRSKMGEHRHRNREVVSEERKLTSPHNPQHCQEQHTMTHVVRTRILTFCSPFFPQESFSPVCSFSPSAAYPKRPVFPRTLLLPLLSTIRSSCMGI